MRAVLFYLVRCNYPVQCDSSCTSAYQVWKWFELLVASCVLTTSNEVVNCFGFCLPPFSNFNFYEKKFLASKIAVVRLVFLLVICSCWYKALHFTLNFKTNKQILKYLSLPQPVVILFYMTLSDTALGSKSWVLILYVWNCVCV